MLSPTRARSKRASAATARFWRSWARGRAYDGPWREAVVRSALALKLLVFAPSGAIAAAATTSLPEEIGGERNWDYRFSWVRDSAFTLDALLRSAARRRRRPSSGGCMHASQLTHPRLQVLYRLDGGAPRPRATLAARRLPRLAAGPDRQRRRRASSSSTSTASSSQTALALRARGRQLDRDIGRRLAEIADLVCELWREPDSGIWEVRSEPRALHPLEDDVLGRARPRRRGSPRRDRPRRARRALAARGRRDPRVRRGALLVRARQSYVRSAGSDELDASVLLAVLCGYDDPTSHGCRATVEAIRRELGARPASSTATRRGRPARARRAPSSPARSGSSRRSRVRAASTRRPS